MDSVTILLQYRAIIDNAQDNSGKASLQLAHSYWDNKAKQTIINLLMEHAPQ